MKLTTEELKQAREWLKDCAWRDLESSEIDNLTDAQVERGVCRHYDGGIAAFKNDAS